MKIFRLQINKDKPPIEANKANDQGRKRELRHTNKLTKCNLTKQDPFRGIFCTLFNFLYKDKFKVKKNTKGLR